MRRWLPLVLVCGVVVWPATVLAEEADLNATGKGISGGALLGGELVVAVEAAFGVQNTWAYLGGGLGGAVAGGVGGYFVEKSSDPTPAHYMFAGGLALMIPTLVAVLQATSYKAPDHYVADNPGSNTLPDAAPPEPDEPGSSITVTPPEARVPMPQPVEVASRPKVPFSLVDMHEGSVRMGVPAVQLVPRYSPLEVERYGVVQCMELRLPVFHATF